MISFVHGYRCFEKTFEKTWKTNNNIIIHVQLLFQQFINKFPKMFYKMVSGVVFFKRCIFFKTLKFIHSRKPTWNPKMKIRKMNLLFKGVSFRSQPSKKWTLEELEKLEEWISETKITVH